MIEPFHYERPTDLAGVLRALAAGATPYAGGTELVAAMKLGLLAPPHVVDLKHVDALSGITSDDGRVMLGAATPHAAAERDETIRVRLPILAAALRTIGNPRVRWQGTLGGNLCFAEPRSDLVPVLIALDASLLLASVDAERQVAAADFITDAFTVDRADDELLVTITIETADIGYQRYLRIQHMERPTVGVALVMRRSGWRLCVGSVGYVPLLRTGSSLDGFDPAEIAEAVEPIEDASGTESYKRHLVNGLVEQALANAKAAA